VFKEKANMEQMYSNTGKVSNRFGGMGKFNGVIIDVINYSCNYMQELSF